MKIVLLIIDKNFEAVNPYSSNFIKFQKNAYQMIDNDRQMAIDTSIAYPVAEKDGIVKCLYKNRLYTLRKISKIDIQDKEFASSLLRDKFKNNAEIVITKESMAFWIRSERKRSRYHSMQEAKKTYHEKIMNLNLENDKLKKKIKTLMSEEI